MTATSPGNTVRAFIARLNDKDLDGAQALLSDDFVWENIGMEPPANRVQGGAGMAHRLRAVFDVCVKIDWIILEQLEAGDTVMNERRDDHYFQPDLFPKSNYLAAPVCGVWKVREGKITLWRDYSDLGDFERQLGMSVKEFGAIIGRNYGQQKG